MTRLEIDIARKDRAWQSGNRRVHDFEDAVRMLGDLGFVLPWRRSGIDLPSWREAYPHDVAREPGPIWRWKEVLPQKRLGYYGKILRKGPCCVSLEYLPCFYALSQRNGEADEYLYSYRMGRLSSTAKQVMDNLVAAWPVSTYELRDRLFLKTRESHQTLNRALDELQGSMYACVAMASDEADREYTYYWAPVDAVFKDQVFLASDVPSAEAARRLVARYVRTVVCCPVAYPGWLFGLKKRTYDRALHDCVSAGEIRVLDGIESPAGAHLVSADVESAR